MRRRTRKSPEDLIKIVEQEFFKLLDEDPSLSECDCFNECLKATIEATKKILEYLEA